jgi:hypothetical protein
VFLGECLNDHALATPKRALYYELIADFDLTVRLRRLAVDVDLSCLARLLSFRASFE